MHRRHVAAVSALATLSLAGCGGGDAPQAAPATVVVTVTSSAAPAAPAPSSGAPSMPATSVPAPSDTGLPSADPSGTAAPTVAPSGGAGGLRPSLGPDGRANPDTWPDACQLVTTDEIKSVVPEAISVRSAGQRGNYASGGETANYVNCTHQVALPTDPAGSPTQIEVELENVADPRIIKASFDEDKARSKRISGKYPDQYAEYGKRFGGDDCFLDINVLHCRAGAFEFQVGGRSTNLSSGTDYRTAQRRFREQTLGKVVKLVADRITSGGAGGSV